MSLCYRFCNAKYRLTLIKSFDERLLGGGCCTVSLAASVNDVAHKNWMAHTNSRGFVYAEGALYGRPDEERASQWAPGTQTTGVSGEVLKWDHDSGKVAISARDYIKQLERELVLLQEQVVTSPLIALGFSSC